jgi:Entner-Doudoroff aldolase
MVTAADHEWFTDALTACPVMAILRGYGPRRSSDLALRAWELGIELVEVPIQSPGDIEALQAVAALGAERGRAVGAGTVITPLQVTIAEEAGARFTVSPGLDADVVRASLDRSLPSLPGVSTPSDLQRALRLGLTWVKVFPAVALGTDWFRAMRGPFPQVSFVATGGMSAVNAPDYLAAGADVVAVGSALDDPGQLDQLATLIRAPRP